MFNPTITEEQEALIDTARKFTAERITPVASELDEEEKFPTDIFEAAWELGLMNVELPEAYGGLGFHTLDGCLIAEELAYGCAGISTSIMCNHLGSLPLLVAGTEEQKQKWLGRLAEEMCFVSYACS
jgi:acyl-CoA dehydrogenase